MLHEIRSRNTQKEVKFARKWQKSRQKVCKSNHRQVTTILQIPKPRTKLLYHVSPI